MPDSVTLPGLQTRPVIFTVTEVPVLFRAAVQVLVTLIWGRHVLNERSAKSFSVAVNDPELRVCGRNVLMQPLNPIPAKSRPTSYSSFVATVPVSIPATFVRSERQAQPPQPTAPRVESLNAWTTAFPQVWQVGDGGQLGAPGVGAQQSVDAVSTVQLSCG